MGPHHQLHLDRGHYGRNPPSLRLRNLEGGRNRHDQELRPRFRPRQYPVNALSPATLLSPLFRRGMSDQQLAAVAADYLNSCVLGRWTRPEEVAMSVVFLASELSSCITGHVLRADSGADLLQT